MGNAESRNFYNTDELAIRDQIENNFQKRESFPDERYGKVTLYNHNHDPQRLLLLKEKWTNTNQESNELTNFITSRSQINHPNVAKLQFYNRAEDKQWCSSFYNHQMAFEFYNRNLAKELHERKHIEDKGDYLNDSTKFFSEAEIWYIIDSLTSVVATFRNNDYHHGDIQPKNILIDNEGFCKLLDNSLVNYGKTAYQKMLLDGRYEAALSPLLLESLKTRAPIPIHSKVKSDMFSVGITALCAATNTKVNHYYDWNQKRVMMKYPQEVEEKLANLGQVGVEDRVGDDLNRMRLIQYSDQLIGVISGLLQYHEADRIGVDELRGFIAQNNLQTQQGQATFNDRFNNATDRD